MIEITVPDHQLPTTTPIRRTCLKQLLKLTTGILIKKNKQNEVITYKKVILTVSALENKVFPPSLIVADTYTNTMQPLPTLFARDPLRSTGVTTALPGTLCQRMGR